MQVSEEVSMRRWLVSLCAVLGTAAATEAPSPGTSSIAIEEFTRFDEVGTVKISPDGKHLALTTGRYGRGALVFVSLEKKAPVGGMRADDPYEIDEFYWASNERVIFTISQRFGSNATPSEIFAMDIDGNHSQLIYGYRAGEQSTGTHMRVRDTSYASAELVSTLKNDDKHVLIAGEAHEERLGKERQEARMDGAEP
jgi:hypothetical protein